MSVYHHHVRMVGLVQTILEAILAAVKAGLAKHAQQVRVNPQNNRDVQLRLDHHAIGYETCSMLSSAEHEILKDHKYKNISRNSAFLSGSNKPRMLFFLLINVKMPIIVGILTFMSRNNFILS